MSTMPKVQMTANELEDARAQAYPKIKYENAGYGVERVIVDGTHVGSLEQTQPQDARYKADRALVMWLEERNKSTNWPSMYWDYGRWRSVIGSLLGLGGDTT